ncbi:MAG: hypothetical protein ACLSGS_11055 [Adlercreutzia sp.]
MGMRQDEGGLLVDRRLAFPPCAIIGLPNYVKKDGGRWRFFSV